MTAQKIKTLACVNRNNKALHQQTKLAPSSSRFLVLRKETDRKALFHERL
jgi:hypothetical protein